MAAPKTPVAAMQARCLSALYDAGEGMTGEELVPLITVTGNETRAWGVLLDLVEAGRVERSGVGEDARYQLSDEERNAEFMRRFYAGEREGA
jgi:DNA-binding transcriptional regulator PaaX